MALSGMAVDAVMDSVSVKTTFKETLLKVLINSGSTSSILFGPSFFFVGSA